MALRITNRDARRLWLCGQGLANAPTGPLNLLQTIRDLGFVQLDTIRNVTRAHHHILWSRNQNYREPMLGKLLAKDRAIFEHFTHDASVLPMEFYPMWTRQFRRLAKKMGKSDYYRQGVTPENLAAIKQRIAKDGPLSTHDFDTKIEGKKEMWDRPPHKRALDHMWYAGELATSHRENFTKFYDLTERVIPEEWRENDIPDHDQIDWLCGQAIDRLGFGTAGDIQRFWDAVALPDVRKWVAGKSAELIDVEIETADKGVVSASAPADIEDRLASTGAPTSRLRILNPFDPAIRDRTRLKQLFGFDYRIEIFVPAAKRRWGYYVYPILEGGRFVGRIELKADRKAGEISVHKLWAEPKVGWTANRAGKLDAELNRLRRLIGAKSVCWRCNKQPGE